MAKPQQSLPFERPAANALTAVETIAFSYAIKDKAVSLARHEVPENSAHMFGFDVRVTGTLIRAAGTPTVTSDVLPTFSCDRRDIVCAALKQLGIGPDRWETALAAVAETPTPQPKLHEVFDRVAEAIAARLPRRAIETPGRSGSFTVQATVTKL